ncbi:MAG: hypothetical protein M1821_004358 [Bathelium mastoideum]|nr:MAG: hypothetical protein M1821_004358 [Bathelium mastoideum]
MLSTKVGLDPEAEASGNNLNKVRGILMLSYANQARINAPGQQVLERNSCVIQESDSTVELRFTVSLPSRGRTILITQAQKILADAIPELVRSSLRFSSLRSEELERHVCSVEDQEHMRSQLRELGLVAFVANGSILPRAGGAYARPMSGPNVVPFQIDAAHQVSLQRLNKPPVHGLGIPTGVTILSGGGFHGKSTLLKALELGIYNHIPGDGRELVVTDPTSVKIRAEDGRSVFRTDITPYATNVPGGQDTRQFTTANASGSTSMAANIQEALEVGCKTLLIDEDSSATNFLIRDKRMQALIQNEPIKPMISRARALAKFHGISTIIVIGGLGDWLSIADNVIVMDSYRPSFRNDEARLICQSHPSEVLSLPDYGDLARHSVQLPWAVSAFRGPNARGKDFIVVLGLNNPKLRSNSDADPGIDLSSVDQIVETGQTRLLAAVLADLARRTAPIDLSNLSQELLQTIEREGLDGVNPMHPRAGDWVWTRGIEVAAMLCRLRGLKADSYHKGIFSLLSDDYA